MKSTTQERLPAAISPVSSDTDDQPGNAFQHAYWTIPNVICMARIVGSFGLIALAINDAPVAFIVCFFVLHLSDWVDGKLARWLNQRSDFGARLDSASDAILYACLLVGCLILKWEVLQPEILFLIVPVISYLATSGFGLWKFGRIPSYHTRLAKIGNWLVLAAAVGLVLDLSLWPMRIASIAGTITNLEAIAITLVQSEWKADVPSIFHVWPARIDPSAANDHSSVDSPAKL